ncbi:DEAD/DEAH box helicase [Streptomyces sp. HB132]|uniref:DEAD/DEAH box helicase n=1 Tax=Streptomyces sp. HB132 TaxID=767388 RepID=UPI001960742C|nr:DEAD/DEAH box helicase [Streptomyces sp. HB132]MBM7443162.1 superfamily II DNA or RNA helicase [Streptomyces sp. HB132]
MHGVISLRPHQVEAVDAIIEGLALPLDGSVPATGQRGQVHMSTGSGKTITAAVAALRMVPRGVVGVLVPTLDLLTQTVEAWRAVGHTAPAVAVCSLGVDPLLQALNVRCTTNPTQLALWANGDGPMLVFATYASLSPQGLDDDQGDGKTGAAPGALERALLGSYGQRLRPFDLLVVDEAHRTSGDLGKAWAAAHDQVRVPAVRRLYMTATPRLWEASPGSAGADETGGRLVASMDDEQLYGPVLFEFGLMESVERGVLARFEIDVLEIRDPQAPRPDASVEARRGRRLAALQEALLKHADESGVRSFMTFHSRTLDAMAFARALPETAAELHATDPVTYPGRVGAEWLCGEHPATHRRTVLGRFADGIDADGWVTDLGVLSSCRVLGEGVDIRGKRGVGAVVFADTRSSPVEIVQIIGRGLRQDPGEGKVSRIIVPVFLEPGEDPSDMMASSSYRSLVAVLQGLRAHDERVIERMALSTTTARGQATSVVTLDPVREHGDDGDGDEDQAERETAVADSAAGTAQGAENGAAGPAAEDETGRGAAEEEHPGAGVPLLRFSLPRDPGTVALFLRTRVLHPDSEVWLTGYHALRTWVREHGNAEVPLDASVELGEARITYALGTWVSEQRRAFRLGTLKAWRSELLNELGMVWSVADAGFWKNLTAARSYHTVHGTLAAPKNAVVEGVAVGQWLANLRKAGGLGKDQERAEERRAALEAIDPEWCPEWSVEWQRHYATARALLAEEGGLTEVLPGVFVHGCDVGAWINRQREHAVWAKLLPEQRQRLEALGLTPLPAAPAKKTASTAAAFERGVLALEQYKARTGTLTVPRTHIETVVIDGQEHGVKLGVFLTNSKTRRAKLPAAKLAALAALGLDWAA